MTLTNIGNDAPKADGHRELTAALRYPITAALQNPLSWSLVLIALLCISAAQGFLTVVTLGAATTFRSLSIDPWAMAVFAAGTVVLGIFSLIVTAWVYSFVETDRRKLAGQTDRASMGKILLTLLTYSVLTAIGLIAFIVPGLIVAFLFLLAPSFSARGYGVTDSFKRAAWSYKSNHVAVGVVGLAITVTVLSAVSTVAAAVFAVVFVIPVYSVLAAHADRFLKELESDSLFVGDNEASQGTSAGYSNVTVHDNQPELGGEHVDHVFSDAPSSDPKEYFSEYYNETRSNEPVFNGGTEHDSDEPVDDETDSNDKKEQE